MKVRKEENARNKYWKKWEKYKEHEIRTRLEDELKRQLEEKENAEHMRLL